MDKTALLAPSSPGTAGHLQRAAPLREGNERGGERTRPFQQLPRGPSAQSGGVEVRTPRGCSQIPAGAADSSPLEHPETARARDPAGPTHRLRRHAGHQAQGEQDPGAPHIPRGPAGSRRWQPERHEASCPAPGRSPRTGIRAKQLQRPPLGLGGSGSGSGAPAPARGALRLLRRPLPSPPLRPGTRRLLTCWFLRSRRRGAAALGRLLSGALRALRFFGSPAGSCSASRLSFSPGGINWEGWECGCS